MIEYKLIAATDVNTFSQLITEAMNEGWRTHGELVVTPHTDSTGYGMQYTQAMSKGYQRVALSTPACISKGDL